MFDPVWLDAVVMLVTGPSWCAGVIIDPAGTVATAYHCVANGSRPQVTLRDGRVFIASVLSRDPAHDLAILQLPAPGIVDSPADPGGADPGADPGADSGGANPGAGDYPWLPIRPGDPIIGEEVWSMGHPFASGAGGRYDGLLRWSVSNGIVSAAGEWYLQTDAALNPGNSGGPLVDGAGRVIGIVSRKFSGDNVAFATRTAHLLHLLAAPDPGSLIGGTYGLGPALIQTPEALYLSANGWISFRDRIVLRGWAGFVPPTAQSGDLGGQGLGAASVEVRQRFGRGALTSTVDLGVGAIAPDGRPRLALTGRLGLGEVGFGAMVQPEGRVWSLMLDLGVPGNIGCF